MDISLKVQNLKCSGCATTIKDKLVHLKGINNINVDVKNSEVHFSYEDTSNLDETKQLLSKLGYPVVGDKNKLSTKAKSFVSCAIGRVNNN